MRSRLIDLVLIAVSSTRSRPWRYFGLVAPVAVGVAVVVASFAAVASARADLEESLLRLGADQIVVSASNTSGRDAVPKLPAEAVERARLLPSAGSVGAMAEQADHAVRPSQVSDPFDVVSATTSVIAADVNLDEALRATLRRGRFLNDIDDRRSADVVVVGSEVARAFAIERPGESTLLIDDRLFAVIGVLHEVQSYPHLNRAVFVPFSTAVARWGDDGRPGELVVRTSPGEARAGAEVLPELITFGEGTAPGARTAADLLSARQEIDDTWGLLVAASGGLALVLGASGIAFALWASVLARTSEIGVRRALGATRRDVTVQFLLETALIGVGAAIIGASIGPAAAVLIAEYNGWPVVVDWLLVLATTSLAVELTVFAGLAPAMRAARQEPLGALRT